VVFDFDALGAEGRDGDDFGGEGGGAAGAVGIGLAHLEEAGIDGLESDVFVELFGAFAFEDDARDAGGAVPDGEIANERATGEGEDVVAFGDGRDVAGEDLAHEDAGVAAIDVDVDGHFVHGEDGGIRGLFGVGNQGPHVGEQAGCEDK
jgi:hypothetical protein